MPIVAWAIWGLLGAFIYAAPRALMAWGEARAGAQRPAAVWISEFIVACATGPIMGAGFGPFAAAVISVEGEAQCRAFALVAGMIANPVAPLIVKWGTGRVLRRLTGDEK